MSQLLQGATRLEGSAAPPYGPELFTSINAVNAPWVQAPALVYAIDGSNVSNSDLNGIVGFTATVGLTYEVSYNCTARTGGTLQGRFFNGTPSVGNIALGPNTIQVVAASTAFIFRAFPGTIATIQDISVRQVL